MAVGLVLGAASSALQIQGQVQAREAQQEYQQRLVDANRAQIQKNRELATESFLAQTAQEYKRLSEARETTATATFDKAREGDKARGALAASAAESGVDGVSLSGLLNDFHRQEATFGLRYATNLEYRTDQADFNVLALRNQAVARTNAVAPYQPAPIQSVNFAGPLLQFAQSSLNAYSTKLYYDRLGAPPTTKTQIDQTTGKPFYDE